MSFWEKSFTQMFNNNGEYMINKRSIISIILFFLFLPVYATGGERTGCQVCGMYIDQYQKTAGKLEYKDGKIVESCGIACLLRMVEDSGGPDAFKSILVRDWISGNRVSADKAFYVLSSRIIPDMLPSIIAFQDPEDARLFREEYGGEILGFTEALLVISPTAMTMPARIKTAVVPAQGAFGLGLGQMLMTMDTVKIGSDSVDPEDFIAQPKQMMGPKKMTSSATMLMANYGITDNLALGVNLAYLDKEMEMYQMGGKKIISKDNRGISDTNVSLRYNFFKSVYYNHFATVLAESTIPTGDFDTEYLKQPGLQTGTGDFTFTGGLLYTYRYKKAWLHTMASYKHKLENSDNFKFGDEGRLGLALHYTPNYDLMFGLETDAIHYDNNELNGVDVGNSGGWRSKIAGVASWRFLTAMGGNFNLRMMVGLPLYEDLNYTSMMGMESVQLGGGWFGSLSLSFKRRYAHH